MPKCPEEAARLVLLTANKMAAYKAGAVLKMNDSSLKCDKILSQRQYAILFAIGYNKIKTIKGLAKIQGQTVSSLSTILSKMELNGYIKKEYPGDGEDGRTIRLSITEKGRDTLDKFTLRFLRELDRFISSMDSDRRRLFDKAYGKLAALIKDTSSIRLGAKSNESSELSGEILKRIIVSVNWAADNYLKEFNKNGKKDRSLTMNQFLILSNITFANCTNMKELSRIMNIGQSSLSIAIKNLAAIGYLRKERPQPGADGRKICFNITEKGELALKTSLDCLYEIFKGHYNTLSDAEKDDMFEGISLFHQLFSNL